jgi:hypothetical protein
MVPSEHETARVSPEGDSLSCNIDADTHTFDMRSTIANVNLNAFVLFARSV